MNRIKTVLRVLCIFGFMQLLVTGVSASDIMFRYDAAHTGNFTAIAGATGNSVSKIWNFTGVSGFTSPAVANDMVYAGSHSGNVYAVNTLTGKEVWHYTTGADVYSSPAVVGGIVYVGSFDGNLYALNNLTGTKVWNYSTGTIRSSPAVANGVVYVGSFDKNLYALNATTGAKIWNYTTGGYVLSSPAVVDDVVYVGSDDYNVYAINATSGSKIWNFKTGLPVGSSPAVVDDVVYVGSTDKNLYALNATTGVKIWDYTTGGYVFSSPAVANGMVYVGSRDDNLYALNASTGTKIWNSTGGYVLSSPAVANGVVYVGRYDNNIYAFNATTGVKLWNYTTGWGVYSSPAVVNGVVYVESLDNDLYALNTKGGTLPSASFTGTPLSGTSPLIVQFNDTSTGSPTAWNWTFGDGSLVNVTEKNPVHTYTAPGTYTVSLNVSSVYGSNDITKSRYITVTPASTSHIGVFRNSHDWYLDSNGNGTWDGNVIDRQYTLGRVGDIPVVGDWNGDGITEIGVFRDNHTWNVDYNGNGLWDGVAGGDRIYITGKPGDVPVPGDWNGNNITEMAVFRDNHTWYIDYNGNGVWDSPVGGDRIYITGKPGDIPVPGDWNGDGITEMAVFRGSHTWYIDYNGNGIWDSPAGGDRIYTTGQPGDIPVFGDWNGDRLFEMGVFRPANHMFYLDFNANGLWDGASIDNRYDFGTYGDIPVSGKW